MMKMMSKGMCDETEETKLFIAALESYHTGKITPILKEELRYRIQTRRLCEGKEELAVNFEQTLTTQALRPDEVVRQHNRREQNRRAASKFRNKRKVELKNLKATCSELEKRNLELRNEVDRLQTERDALYTDVVAILNSSSATGNI